MPTSDLDEALAWFRSAIEEGYGGYLKANLPALQGAMRQAAGPQAPEVEGLKSLPYRTKSEGEPCKQGETSKTGCVPASGEGKGKQGGESGQSAFGMLKVTGDTYANRQAIKQAGGKWDAESRTWWVPARNASRINGLPGLEVAGGKPDLSNRPAPPKVGPLVQPPPPIQPQAIDKPSTTAEITYSPSIPEQSKRFIADAMSQMPREFTPSKSIRFMPNRAHPGSHTSGDAVRLDEKDFSNKETIQHEIGHVWANEHPELVKEFAELKLLGTLHAFSSRSANAKYDYAGENLAQAIDAVRNNDWDEFNREDRLTIKKWLESKGLPTESSQSRQPPKANTPIQRDIDATARKLEDIDRKLEKFRRGPADPSNPERRDLLAKYHATEHLLGRMNRQSRGEEKAPEEVLSKEQMADPETALKEAKARLEQARNDLTERTKPDMPVQMYKERRVRDQRLVDRLEEEKWALIQLAWRKRRGDK